MEGSASDEFTRLSLCPVYRMRDEDTAAIADAAVLLSFWAL
jgi:hypothetical protein